MHGFTLIEMLVLAVIMAIATAMAIPIYDTYLLRGQQAQAMADIGELQLALDRSYSNDFQYPPDLAAVGMSGRRDPWGRPYVYLRIEGGGLKGKGDLRKDKNLNPLNSDYDLYSIGKDGLTQKPLTAPQSHDDIVRAGNGAFIGVAEDF